MRVHANVAKLLDQDNFEWKTPCCSQPAILVKPTGTNKTAFFRHYSHAICPFANVVEYNYSLHWEIISYILDLIKERCQWHRFLYSSIGLRLTYKLFLWNPRNPKQEFIVHNNGHSLKKRIDLLLGKVALEIQCSGISEDEVILRQIVYHQNGFKICWIIGLTDGTLSNKELVLPYEASNRIQNKMKTLIKKEKRIISQISPFNLKINGIRLKHWQFYL